MSERGVFAVDRGIFDHPLFDEKRKLSRLEAWLWLLAEAAWKPGQRRIGSSTIELQRGQLVHSVRFMAAAWGWSKSAVDRFLDVLRTETMIGTDAGTGCLVITVCNYDSYQKVSLPDRDTNGTVSGTAAGQQRDRLESKENKKEEDSSLRSLSDATTNFEPEPAKPRRPSPRKPADTEHLRFPEFWDVYPKREGRKPASAKFSAAVARGVDPDLIIDGAKRYAAAKAGTDPQYIKQAEVWLNQERWNDEHANPAGRQPGRGPHRADASPDAEPFSRNVRVAALAEFRQERLARERQAPEPEIPDFFGGNEQDKPSGRLSEPRVVSGFDSFRDRTGAIFDAEVGWTHSVRS